MKTVESFIQSSIVNKIIGPDDFHRPLRVGDILRPGDALTPEIEPGI